MIIILGAGIAGISAGYHLALEERQAVVFEKRQSWGGLCDNFKVGEFSFDNAVHLSFTTDPYVKELFAESTPAVRHAPPLIGNYYYGTWLKHPVQSNLYPLDIDLKIRSIIDFIGSGNCDRPGNYEEWLDGHYGKYFSELFPKPYTKKYWTTSARNLTVDWIGERMYTPDLEELLRGAMTEDTSYTYYAPEMFYPVEGGFKSFIRKMAEKCNIRCNKEVVAIDPLGKKIEFADGGVEHYDQLISSLPLPEIVRLLDDPPEEIIEAAGRLTWTSVSLVSLGFNRPDIPDYLWFYIYDEEILPARCSAPSLKSPRNAPAGRSSLQLEIFSSPLKPLPMSGASLVEHVVNRGKDMGVWEIADIVVYDHRLLDYGNVIFDRNRRSNTGVLRNYLSDLGIITIGRFGEWDYMWSDQSLLSGQRGAKEVIR